MQAIASQNAPSPAVIVPHFIFGGLAWLSAAGLIALFPEAFIGHYFNPKLLALTHLLALGWITMVIFGALYQLIPVVMEVKLFSERMATAAFALLGAGAVLLAVAFWHFQLGHLFTISVALIIPGVLLFAANVMITGSRSKTASIERDFILTSALWLLFTVLAGATLALNLVEAFLETPHLELLKLHAHAGLAGWFIQLIIGVASKLLPMFLVSHKLKTRRLQWAYYLLNAGLLLGVISLGVEWRPGALAGLAGVLGSLGFFLSYLWGAYRTRVKKQLDIGMRQSALAFLLLLLPLAAVLLYLSPERFTMPLAIAYGSALFLGFITSLIMGQTYKTLPFIVWLKVYRGKVGKGKTPMPKDLYSERAAHIQFWLFLAGFLALMAGILLQQTGIITAAGISLFAATAFYNYNIFKIVWHKPKDP